MGKLTLSPPPSTGGGRPANDFQSAIPSRGKPIGPLVDQKSLESGKATFFRRQGQLNLSCAQCHDDHWGHKLAGSVIPQAHPTGYPVYRLEWQGRGSLARRVRNCMVGVLEPPAVRP